MQNLQVADSSTKLKLRSVTVEWRLYNVCATKCNFGYKTWMIFRVLKITNFTFRFECPC